jgi:phosphoribosylanthranilate isomerase
VIVKICGLRDARGLDAAIEAGADYVGFILAPSRRQVDLPTLAALVARIPPGGPAPVGVFVDPAREDLDQAIAQCGIRGVQLSGDRESPELVAGLGAALIRTVRPLSPDDTADAASFASLGAKIHLDTPHGSAKGGTGLVGDWGIAAAWARRRPILLAGGLRPENVEAAIAAVRPAGVDVSSGVEEAGEKSPERIRAFVERARRAMEER